MEVDMKPDTFPLPCTTYHVKLPLSNLHIMEAGSGPPLIVVPATISELKNWVDLIQFMAQWFRVYFFELPGHGESTPFRQKFTTTLVAKTVAQLVDHLGIGRFNLMGFSFGGILAMRTFNLLNHRIDRIILNAPCLTKQAILLSTPQRFALQGTNSLFRKHAVQVQLHRAFHHSYTRTWLMKLFQIMGKLEHADQLEHKLAVVKMSTLEVLTEEIADILSVEFPHPARKFDVPCFLTMSVNDPLLDFQVTLKEAQSYFSVIYLTKLYYPFHQPPKPFTFDELNCEFGESVRKFL
jgi:pimeloyl-ACP methyl ester carboxylesterase